MSNAADSSKRMRIAAIINGMRRPNKMNAITLAVAPCSTAIVIIALFNQLVITVDWLIILTE